MGNDVKNDSVVDSLINMFKMNDKYHDALFDVLRLILDSGDIKLYAQAVKIVSEKLGE